MSLKAVVLISGGLDSSLAAKVVSGLGVDVFGLAFITPFVHPEVDRLAQSMGIQVRSVDISTEYLDLIKNPSFGFGKNMNPCIDCHIFMLRKAKELMPEYNADFVISGDILGQRPMSQNSAALRKIEKESGLEGLLLRPLSAKLLIPTLPEQRGWVDRNRLFDFSGRSRKPQLELAEKLGLNGFSQPGASCLLTDPGFSRRVKDILTYQPDFNLDDIELLKIGRHFRISSEVKLVLGRDKDENQRLIDLAGEGTLVLEPRDTPGPSGILKGEAISSDLLELSAGILARYCDQKDNHVLVSIEDNGDSRTISCSAQDESVVDGLRI